MTGLADSNPKTAGSVTVAALYVDPNGVYANLPDVEVWDEARDARLYAGPWPVVAHPPCAVFCRWAWLRERDGYGKAGEDGGCFAAALAAVRTWGGVLEHPAHTTAFRLHGLPDPTGLFWQATMCGGWVCEVDQRFYGHQTSKPTWLYAYGASEPLSLVPGVLYQHREGEALTTKNLSRRRRRSTPAAFRDVLIDMARTARTEAAS